MIPPHPKDKKWRRKWRKNQQGKKFIPIHRRVKNRTEVMVTFFDGSRFEEELTVVTFGTVFAVVSVLFPVVILVVVVFVILFPCVDSTFFALVSAFFVTLDFGRLEGEGE